ncbi:flagellar motor protein MotB [Priestia megaterium]
MSRGRKGKEEEEDVEERWVVGYSDLVRVLVGLLIVLFGMR